jgi:hypothetical protein
MKDEPKPNVSWSMRRLSGYECAWCGQRLDQAKRGHCSAIYSGKDECHWYKALNVTPSTVTEVQK